MTLESGCPCHTHSPPRARLTPSCSAVSLLPLLWEAADLLLRATAAGTPWSGLCLPDKATSQFRPSTSLTSLSPAQPVWVPGFFLQDPCLLLVSLALSVHLLASLSLFSRCRPPDPTSLPLPVLPFLLPPIWLSPGSGPGCQLGLDSLPAPGLRGSLRSVPSAAPSSQVWLCWDWFLSSCVWQPRFWLLLPLT